MRSSRGLRKASRRKRKKKKGKKKGEGGKRPRCNGIKLQKGNDISSRESKPLVEKRGNTPASPPQSFNLKIIEKLPPWWFETLNKKIK